MIGGVTRRILPHPSGVLQLCVKKPLEKYLSNAERRAESETRSGSKVSRTQISRGPRNLETRLEDLFW